MSEREGPPGRRRVRIASDVALCNRIIMDKKALHKRKMAGKRAARAEQAAKESAAPASSSDDSSSDDEDAPYDGGKRRGGGGGSSKGIRWQYVAFLVLLFGTTALPAVFWVLDSVGGLVGKGAGGAMGGIGAKLGMSATPRDRLAKFYAKHNPDKVDEVGGLIAKYAGNYPKMIKVLEAKYNDYGFFLGWQEDESFKGFLKKEGTEAWVKAQFYYKKYAPYKVRMALYKMYDVLATTFSPGLNLVRTYALNVFPELKDYIGAPAGYRPPKAYTAAKRASRSGTTNKRKKPSTARS